jgi:UDP-GlcNAc3NAcA epimerase
VYDALLDGVEIARRTSTILDRLRIEPQRFILATVHRAENTDQPRRLEGIVTALVALARAGHTVIFPVHPRTQKQLSLHSIELCERVVQINPVPCLDMLLLESMARFILTDSGGVQKEAYWLQVPCLTLRDETEWEETVQSGWNRLIGTDAQRILRAVEEVRPGSGAGCLWQRGEASRDVVRLICEGRQE